MATKPTTLPRWASLVPPSPDPGSAKQDVGWKTGERPPARYKNWLQYWNYKWIEYLNDGALQGAHTFNSTVGITGTLTTAQINATSVAVSGTLNANGGIVAGANQHITVSGTGDYKHGDRILLIDGSAGIAYNQFTNIPYDPTEWTYDIFGWRVLVTSPDTAIKVPIPLTVGDRIKSATFYFHQSNPGDFVSQYSISASGLVIVTGSLPLGFTNGEHTLTIVGPTALTSLGSPPFAHMQLNGGTVRWDYLKITYDRP